MLFISPETTLVYQTPMEAIKICNIRSIVQVKLKIWPKHTIFGHTLDLNNMFLCKKIMIPQKESINSRIFMQATKIWKNQKTNEHLPQVQYLLMSRVARGPCVLKWYGSICRYRSASRLTNNNVNHVLAQLLQLPCSIVMLDYMKINSGSLPKTNRFLSSSTSFVESSHGWTCTKWYESIHGYR